ncbi:hypothetical protein PNEG_01113 [Pneumocystis murina B123]|uniref:Glutamine amidotransferase type-2 domain-containing protein n=1 Tax=Pneumocystis murina (strain B123) TaxID=1069680 RepID=M7NNX2_PNEMU|nr:hypothetical protein PNEG_01113 [Pneumocystis murina B123]EMR10398.1 hypothetical protein PNEG_01113 [Pneumocystis murina B123]
MCGIFLMVTRIHEDVSEDYNDIIELINVRGPDGSSTIEIIMKEVKLKICCSVLHLRGKGEATLQPLENDQGDLLCWNGEVWNGLGIKFTDNDTIQVMNALSKPFTNVIDIIREIEGPYAFIFIEKSKERLWYGRDCLGRRSLLKKTSTEICDSFCFLLSSVSNGDPSWEEVFADGLYFVDLSLISENKLFEKKIPYIYDFDQFSDLYLTYPYPRINTSLESVSTEDLDLYVEEFYNVLKQALYIRTVSVFSTSTDQPRLAILYSGGLDSSVLARIIHEILPVNEPVDLLNVAFENFQVSAQKTDSTDLDDIYNCPDRITGINAYKELCKITGNKRPWRFVQINVPYFESNDHKPTIIKLMHPNDTVMDLSIAMAFYFASRGQGLLRCTNNSLLEYNSVSKVLISGKVYYRADEQLGGYSRYLKKYIKGGWLDVIEELSCNISRLSYRNLGRDDRIVSHHGKEIRYPYLDENVMRFLSKLPVQGKMNFNIENGEKLLLRKLSRKLGLIYSSKEKKRAIQFGSRSAKMQLSNKKISGTNKLEKD